MMNKIISVGLVIVLVFMLSACGNKDVSLGEETNISQPNYEMTGSEIIAEDSQDQMEKKEAEDKEDENEGGEKKSSEISKTEHVHSFSDATCVLPQKCSCGETKGSAIGHKWQEATCKVPKTCSVCKATDGNVGNHKYVNGYCVYCNEKQVINPKVGLKENANYYYITTDDSGIEFLYVYQFSDGGVKIRFTPGGVYSTKIELKDGDDTINYNGKIWYQIGWGGSFPEYTLTDTEIIIKYSAAFAGDPFFANAEYRLIVNYTYDLEVTYSSDGRMFQKGKVLDLID